MVSLLPSSWPASYVRSLLEGTGMNRAVMFHFFLGVMLAEEFTVMAGTGTAANEGAGSEGQVFLPPRQDLFRQSCILRGRSV